MTRRHLLELAALSVAGALTATSAAAQAAKTTTVTLTIEGMT